MLNRRRPLEVLRLASEAVDILAVRNQDAAGWSVLPRLVVAIVSSGGASSIDPVGAVELGFIQVAHGREKMRGAATLNGSLLRGVSGMRTDTDAVSSRVELLRAHIDILAIA